jgi:microcystin-dependent protein
MKIRTSPIVSERGPWGRARRWGLRAGALAVVTLGGATAVYAAGLVKWSNGQTLTADDLNANFSMLQDQVTQLQQLQQQQSGVPAGTVTAFAGPAVPAGWLKCDGTAVSRTTYAGLYQVIGTVHGSGDGATTFNLPDYRGMFLRGVDEGSKRDPDAATRTAPNAGGNVGDLIGSVEKAALAAHAHAVTDPGHTHAVSDPGHGHGVNDPGHGHGVNDPGHAHNFTFGAGTGGSSSINDYFRNAGFNFGRSTDGAFTGISIQGSGTGITIQGSGTGVSVRAAASGVSVQSAGGAETRPLNAAVIFIIKT